MPAACLHRRRLSATSCCPRAVARAILERKGPLTAQELEQVRAAIRGSATQVEGVEAAEGAESDIAGRPESVDDIRTRIDAGITHGGSKPAERRPPRGFAAPDIEHGPESGQFLDCERDDLLLVLGIRTIRETVDPPLGVSVPQ